MTDKQKSSERLEALTRVIRGLSKVEDYSQFQSLCNEAKFQMIVRSMESEGSIKAAARALGYSSNSTLFHVIDTRLGQKPENYQVDTIKDEAQKTPPPEKYKDLLADFTAHTHNRADFDSLLKASTTYLFITRLKDNNYATQKTADDLGMAKSSLNRATKKLGIDPKQMKFGTLDAQVFMGEQEDAINALIPLCTFKSLKEAYQEAKKHHIHDAFMSNPKTMSELSRQLGHNDAAIKYDLKNLFGIEYQSIEDTKERLKDYDLSDKPEVLILVDNTSNLSSLHELFINARSALIITTLEENDYVSARAAEELEIDRSRISIHLASIEKEMELRKLSSLAIHDIPPPPPPSQMRLSEYKAQQENENSDLDEQTSSFLTQLFSYKELTELKVATTKALIAQTLAENNFDVEKSAEDLDLSEQRLINGLRNYFRLSVTPQTQTDEIQRKVEAQTNTESDFESTIRDILPQISSYTDLSHTFSHALNTSIINEWKATDKNSTKTANNLGISENTVLNAIPSRGIIEPE